MLGGGLHHESCIGQSWALCVLSGCWKYPSMDSNNLWKGISTFWSPTDTVKCFWIQLTHGGFPKLSQCIHSVGKNAHRILIYSVLQISSLNGNHGILSISNAILLIIVAWLPDYCFLCMPVYFCDSNEMDFCRNFIVTEWKSDGYCSQEILNKKKTFISRCCYFWSRKSCLSSAIKENKKRLYETTGMIKAILNDNEG